MNIHHTKHGVVICGDSTARETVDAVVNICGPVGLIVADPPYGNIVSNAWDRVGDDPVCFAMWLAGWTHRWAEHALIDGGAMYVWGGIGKPGFRPFLHYVTMVEADGILQLANWITWSKKRAYGVKHNYLFTREECAYFVKGNIKRPATFNIPLLDTKRGYAGYDAKYPAKSEYYRRTNVWSDVTEIFRGKMHPTAKPSRLAQIQIETHTNPGDWVIDPFAGSGSTAIAAIQTGRRFIVIDSDPGYCEQIVRAVTELD